MKIIVGALILLLPFLFASCSQNDNLTREEVIAAIKKFDEGWQSKNSKTVDSILADPYIYFTQSGGVYSRDNVVQTAGSPEYQLSKMSRHEFVVQLQGNTAVVGTIWDGKGIYRTVPFDDHQRCSLTIIKYNGKVQILSEHCTVIR
jgi:hypothetical protein